LWHICFFAGVYLVGMDTEVPDVRIGKLILPSLFIVSLGCAHRPANVPASAVKVDGVFIDCSVEASIHANRCTIYKGDTGEALSSGQFVISGTGREAQSGDLKYAASDGSRIFLWDARILYPMLPRADKLLENKLKLSVGNAAINCGVVPLGGDPNRASDCALEAFTHRRAFYVYVISEGGISPSSDGSGDVMMVDDPTRVPWKSRIHVPLSKACPSLEGTRPGNLHSVC
jgi:hypothetical protein